MKIIKAFQPLISPQFFKSNRRVISLVNGIGLAVALAHAPSFGAATAYVDVQGGPGQQLTYYENDPGLVIAQTSGSSGDSVASSYADMRTGILRDFAHATNAYPGTPYAATASSTIGDTVVFSGGVGQTAYVDWSFDGTLAYTSSLIGNFGQFLVYIDSSFANIMLSANGGNCGGGILSADCTVATSVNKQGSIAFTIQPRQMSFATQLQA